MGRGNKNKAAGTKFERDIKDALISAGFDTERTASVGMDKGVDVGDLHVHLRPGLTLVIQAKRRKGRALGLWMEQASEQASAASSLTVQTIPAVVHKLRGVGAILKQPITLELGEIVKLLWEVDTRVDFVATIDDMDGARLLRPAEQ